MSGARAVWPVARCWRGLYANADAPGRAEPCQQACRHTGDRVTKSAWRRASGRACSSPTITRSFATGSRATSPIARNWNSSGRHPTGVEALELIRALAPDVGVIDLRMPRIDGIRVAAAIA